MSTWNKTLMSWDPAIMAGGVAPQTVVGRCHLGIVFGAMEDT